MIRGSFRRVRGIKRPYVDAIVRFPTLGSRHIAVALLVDTGADYTVLAPNAAVALGDSAMALGSGPVTVGVGGRRETRLAPAVVLLGTTAIRLHLVIFLPTNEPTSMPSILGRDVLSRFALVIEERADRVLLLEPEESERLNWP